MKFLALLFLITSNEVFSQPVKSFANKDVQLFYEVKGKGPALYILTGGPGAPPDEQQWWLDSLKKHFTVVLLHQRGSGSSRNIPMNEKTINIAAYTSDIEALRRHRKDKKIILLGISWSGLLAMNYAVSYPINSEKLVLIGSAPPTYKEWHVLADNQYARFSIAERDSMMLLQQIFSTKTPLELVQLKQSTPPLRNWRHLKNSCTFFTGCIFMNVHLRIKTLIGYSTILTLHLFPLLMKKY